MTCATQGDARDAVQDQCFRTENGDFRFRTPARLMELPDVLRHVQRVDAELADGMEMVARQDKTDARAAGLDFRPWRVQLDWTLVGLNPNVASLIATGELAARPSKRPTPSEADKTAIAMLVDRRAGALLTSMPDVFSYGMNSVRATYCTHLDIQRIANALAADPRAGEKADAPIIDDAGRYLGRWACPYFEELAIGFSGTDGAPFDTIHLVAKPGTAGPYADGYYRVSFKLLPTMVEEIRPQFRDAFRAGSGNTPEDGRINR